MRHFQDTFETRKRSFICTFSICMTVPISNTLISKARLKLAKKIKQKLSNTLRLKFCYLKIIRFIHPRYHPKIIGDILKNLQKLVRLFK